MLKNHRRLGRPVPYHEVGAAPQTELCTSIVWVRALVGALLKRGVDRDELLRDTWLSPSQLGDTCVQIPLAEWCALVQRALFLTRDDGLGIAIGASAPDNALQIVGQLARASETLRDALRVLERYRLMLGDTRLCNLVEEGERAYLVHTPAPYPEPQLARFATELTLSLLYRLSHGFAGREGDELEEVWFAYPAPSYAARYAEVFRCPVRFDRPRSAIVIGRRCLDRRQLYGDPWFAEVLRDCADRMLAELHAPNLADQVRALLRHEVDLRGVDASRVAHMLKLDPRRLRHRLIGCNAPWSLLVDEARRQIACDELRRGDRSLTQLADRLGFSDQSAFNRAFKRWTGSTPAKYGRDARAHKPERAAR